MAVNSDIDFHLRHNYTWSRLPSAVKQTLGDNEKTWNKAVIDYSVKNQLRWRGNVVRHVHKDERKYYENLLKYSREHLMLFPYHLSEVMVKGLRVTPFAYYCEILRDIMDNERSYDSLPNFTAADCLRLLGIGRNQYIDLMNTGRTKSKFSFRKRSTKELLPKKPVPLRIVDWWWIVHIGHVTEDDIKMCNKAEHSTVDILIDHGPKRAGEIDFKVVQGLYYKGLIYLEVPIDDGDYITVPPLEGFVMNRVQGDYFETLLYKIFVSLDEHTSVAELATVLQIDVPLVKNAFSMYIRLGFAFKKGVEANWDTLDVSWKERPISDVRSGTTTTTTSSTEITQLIDLDSDSTDPQQTSPAPENHSTDGTSTPPPPIDTLIPPDSGFTKRIGFLFDSTLTAFLMMGNLTPGLKTHAVTMFEVGKLPDESLDSLLTELHKVGDFGEGEAMRYFEHALTLRNSLEFLRRNKDLMPIAPPLSPIAQQGLGIDLLRCESVNSLDAATCRRILNKNYSLLVSMAPLSQEISPVSSVTPQHIGPAIAEVNSVWFKFWIYEKLGWGPSSILFTKGTRLRRLPRVFMDYDFLLLTTWGHDSSVVASSNALLSINDALTHSPLLIQGHGHQNEGKTIHVTFPFDSPEANPKGSSLGNIASHPSIAKMPSFLDVSNSCGFFTLINTGSETRKRHSVDDLLSTDDDDVISDDTLESWVPLEVHFGLPLFDVEVNKRVCEKIAKHGLFHENRLESLLQSSRKLALELLTFIDQLLDEPTPRDFSPDAVDWQESRIIPQPSRHVAFLNNKLQFYNYS